MRTHVTAMKEVPAEPWPVVERFMRSPELWLPPPGRPTVDGAYVSTARVGPLLHAVRVEVGDAWSINDAITRRLTWIPSHADGTPVHTVALPDFAGQLTLRHEPGHITASLEGVYQPPGGAFGAALDRAVLHHTGDATGRELLDDILTLLLAPANEEAPI